MCDCVGLGCVRLYSDFMLAQGASEATLRMYRYAILRLLAEVQKDTLRDVTEQDVVVFLASLNKRAAARQTYFRAYRSIFGWAVERGHADVDPSRHLKVKPAPQRDADAFSPEEIVALIQAAKLNPKNGEQRAALITAAYSMGLRRSELCTIRPDDVDWGNGRVHLRETKGNKPRYIEMNALARESLEMLASLPRKEPNDPLAGIQPQWFTMIVHAAAQPQVCHREGGTRIFSERASPPTCSGTGFLSPSCRSCSDIQTWP